MAESGIDDAIVRAAREIGCATPHADLLDAQMAFWLSIQTLMRHGGYESVRKRAPFVSQSVANAVAQANLRQIRTLCNEFISTLRPSLPDETVLGLLTEEPGGERHAKLAFQLLAETLEGGIDDRAER